MPMNPRLLRPRQKGGDPDALRYIAAVQAADGQPLEAGVRKAIDAFITGCKADGIWNSIKASCLLMGARTLAGALTPLVGTAPTNANFVSGDYNRKTGLVGDGSTKYLNSNRNNNADPQDSQHAAVFVSTSTTSGPTVIIGTGGSTGRLSVLTGASYSTRSRSSTAQTAGAASVGLVGVSRSVSTSYIARTGGSSNTVSVASQTPLNENIGVFAQSTGFSPTVARLAFYSIGESLDLSLLDTRVSALYTAIGAAIP